MALKIMLLDCPDELGVKLAARDCEVHVGFTGFGPKPRAIQRQVYEMDLVIYDPRFNVGLKTGVRIPDHETGIDFTPLGLYKHIDDGGHWLVFVNRVGEREDLQRRSFQFQPALPPMKFTQDHELVIPSDLRDQKYMAPYLPLLYSPGKPEIKLPVSIAMDPDMILFPDNSLAPMVPLLTNRREEILAGVVISDQGSLTALPTCSNNTDAALFFVDFILPNLKKTGSPGGLVDEFHTTEEESRINDASTLHAEFVRIAEDTHDNQQLLVEARRRKVAKIKADKTAEWILIYYRKAQEDHANAATHLYKVRDALAQHFGGETPTKQVLNCAADYKFLGKTLNDPSKDARHGVAPGEAVVPLDGTELKECFAAAKRMILAYFKTLFPPTGPGSPTSPPSP